jgi:hypothetical protein
MQSGFADCELNRPNVERFVLSNIPLLTECETLRLSKTINIALLRSENTSCLVIQYWLSV